jgi:putative ABC transport system ATP-binding protein
MSNIYNLKQIERIYVRGREKIHAISKVDLQINQGELVAIVGPSGSGKSTLLNVLGCVDKPTFGEIIVDNENVTGFKEHQLINIRRKKIGFIFQQFFLIPTLTAWENVQLPGLFNNNTERVGKAKELLSLVGLENRLEHLPSELSGGEMQRTAIARSLINSPNILLADEPTGNLDTKNSEAIFDMLRVLNQKGLTIIIVTHNMELAKKCNRILRMRDGMLFE